MLTHDELDFEKLMEQHIISYKEAVFPNTKQIGENVPNWDTDIGGLTETKT